MIRVKKYGTAVLIWMLLIPIAILNGGLREYVLVHLGVIAQPLSGIILSACIFAAAFFPASQNQKLQQIRLFPDWNPLVYFNKYI